MTDTTNTTAAKHYAKRDPDAQGIHYINHVSAMTTEGLHAKSAIAAELAHRDIEIERLRAALATPAREVAPTSHPVAMPEPHYGKGRYLGFARYNDAYSAAQVQAMLAAAPRNATLYDPDDVAFPTQRCADGTDAPTELTSIAKQASIAAVEVAAPSGPAREPLTDEQVEELLSEANRGFCIETEDYFKAFRDAEIAHGITAAKKGGQHGAE